MAGERKTQSPPPPGLITMDLEGVAKYIRAGHAKRIVVMAGAGISTAAGIPDFRTPGTGLYSQLEKYKLPRPEAVFDLAYFKTNPYLFAQVAKELYPNADKYKPTLTHHFLALLAAKGLLQCVFTQNIDGLEKAAGVPRGRVEQVHGTFETAHCTSCGTENDGVKVRDTIVNKKAIPVCEYCLHGLVKPDIVFFGESLPVSCLKRVETDFPTADLLLIMGTSLSVKPFAHWIAKVPTTCPRVLINLEPAGHATSQDPDREQLRKKAMEGDNEAMYLLQSLGDPSDQNDKDATHLHFYDAPTTGRRRDVFVGMSADDAVVRLSRLLGWEDQLAKREKAQQRQAMLTNDEKKQSSVVVEMDDETAKPPHNGADDIEESVRSHVVHAVAAACRKYEPYERLSDNWCAAVVQLVDVLGLAAPGTKLQVIIHLGVPPRVLQWTKQNHPTSTWQSHALWDLVTLDADKSLSKVMETILENSVFGVVLDDTCIWGVRN